MKRTTSFHIQKNSLEMKDILNSFKSRNAMIKIRLSSASHNFATITPNLFNLQDDTKIIWDIPYELIKFEKKIKSHHLRFFPKTV